MSLGAPPLGAEDGQLGCLTAVGDAADGFGAEQRGFLKQYADAIAGRLHPPQPAARPETWRSEWHSEWRSEWRSEWPDAPINALPTLRTGLRHGRMSLLPAGTALEPGLSGVGPGGLAVLPLPAKGRIIGVCLAGRNDPHEFVPDERSPLPATAGPAGRAHAYDAEQELATMLQRSLDITTTTIDNATTKGVPAFRLAPIAVTGGSIRQTLVKEGVCTIDQICTPKIRPACDRAGLTRKAALTQ